MPLFVNHFWSQNAVMGGRWRRRNTQHSDDFQFQASDRWGKSSGETTIPAEDVPLGPYTVSGHGRRDISNRNPFRFNNNDNKSHQHRVFFQRNGNRFEQQRTSPTTPRMKGDFCFRSTRFREYILQTLNKMLRQVQQWNPEDEPSSESEMDWQPEVELVIPQSAEEIHYVWDLEPVAGKSALAEEDENSPEVGVGLGISIGNRRRSAGGENNGLGSGLSSGWSPVGLEGCISTPRSGFVVRRTVPPLRDMETES